MTLSASPVEFLVAVRRRAVVLTALPGHDCGLDELVLLEELARSGTAAPDTDEMRQFVDELRGAGLWPDASGPATAPDVVADNGPHAVDDELLYALPVPILLGLSRAGFDEHDHDGRVRVRMSAIELAAALQFRVPMTVATALKKHRARRG